MTNTYVDSSEVIAPPPALYLGTFLLGFLVHVTSPLSLFSLDTARWAIGTLLINYKRCFRSLGIRYNAQCRHKRKSI